MSAEPVIVRHAQRDCPVHVGAGLLGRLGPMLHDLTAPNTARRVFVAVDSGVGAGARDAALTSLGEAFGGGAVFTSTLTPTEAGKSIDTVGELCKAMAGARLERRDLVVALGGGIIGDTAGFAAASYRRGVRVAQAPTTLLAMVDASIGGKTGVNLRMGDDGPLLKNMVGAFHPPVAVIADIDALATLDDRHFVSGLGECVKHGLIGLGGADPDLSAWTMSSIGDVLAHDRDAVVELVRRSAALKAHVVSSDERETGDGADGRMSLNLGHTFAHAFEALGLRAANGPQAGRPLTHGEAVGVGLVAAAHAASHASMAERLGEATPVPAEEVKAAVSAAGLPTRVAGAEADEIVETMADDKKTDGGVVRLILPTRAGIRIADRPPAQVVRDAVRAVLA